MPNSERNQKTMPSANPSNCNDKTYNWRNQHFFIDFSMSIVYSNDRWMIHASFTSGSGFFLKRGSSMDLGKIIVCPGCGWQGEKVELTERSGFCICPMCDYENGFEPYRLLTLQEILDFPAGE